MLNNDKITKELKYDDFSIFYYVIGDASDSIILLHGNNEDHHIFDTIAERLSKDYKVILIDTRGQGKSVYLKDLHYSDFALDLENIINIEKVNPVLFGFSDGAITILKFLEKHTDYSKKVILSGINITPNGLKLFPRLLMKFCYFFTRSRFLKLMLTEPNFDLLHLKKITTDVLITIGEKDMVSLKQNKELNKILSNSTLNLINHENHASYVFDNQKLEKIILDYLK